MNDVMPAGGGPRGLAHDVLDSALDDLSRPAWRAGAGAGLVTTAILCRAGMRLVPVVIISTTIALTVERLYGMAEDIHHSITAGRDDTGTPRTV